MIEPGKVCPTCERRVNYPRKKSSPESQRKYLRMPADDETFDEDLARVLLIMGITSEHKYPVHAGLRFLMDTVTRDEDEWKNAYLKEWVDGE